MDLVDETQAKEKGRQNFIKKLSELEGDVSIVRTKIKKLIIDFNKAQENSSVELSSSLNRGVETHRQVLCSLHKASSNSLLEPLGHLNSLCPSIKGSLNSLNISQTNITSTLSIISPFVNLERTLMLLKQEMASDDKLPFVISQSVKFLEFKTRLLAKSSDSTRPGLIQLLKPLEEFDEYISAYIWKIIENAVEITKKDPKSLAKITRIIDKIEANPEKKIQESLAKGIVKRLEWLLGTDKLDELAENTHTAISELKFMLDNVLPNFPEKYNLRDFCIKKYRESIESAIDPHFSNLEKLRNAPGLLVLIFQWISEYGEAIKKLCPNANEELEIQLLFAKVKELMPDFLTHMEGLLSEWINRALNAHISNQQILELATGNEPLTDTFPEEMFSAINQQLSFISNRLTGEVLIEVFRVCSNRLISQQKKQMTQVEEIIKSRDPEIQVPSFCLSINNNQRSSKHSLELQKFCQSKVSEEFHKERIENLFAIVSKGFLNLCNETVSYMAMSVMISMSEVTLALLFTAQWGNSRPASVAFATMEDYDKDISKWLASDFYLRKFRKRFFEIFIQAYLERIVQVFCVLNSSNYEPTLLPFIMQTPDDYLNKKELTLLLSGSFRELINRDKYECAEFCNKFEIGFDCEYFFSTLLKVREGRDLEALESKVKPFIANSRDLINAVATVLTGKLHR